MSGVKLKPTRVGMDPISTFSFTAATIVNYFLTAALIAVCVTAVYLAIDATNQNVGQNARMTSIENKEAADVLALTTLIQGVNSSLCTKIMDVNSTLHSELDLIMSALNISNNTSYNFTAFVLSEFAIFNAYDAYLNQSITNETIAREAKDSILMQNVSDLYTTLINNTSTLQADIDTRIKTINGLSSDAAPSNNFIIAVNPTGLGIDGAGNTITLNNTGVTAATAGQGISVDVSTGNVTVTNTGVLDVNEVPPDTTGTLFLVGASGTAVNNTYAPNTVLVETSSLVTSITNVQVENANQMAQIANLTAVDANLQMQITSITMAGQMVADALNGTTITFNMTLMQLITDVMTLQSQVVALQAQVANLTAVATPTGTIVPWGGSLTPPTGYLLCDGSTVSNSTYAALYAVIGCKFCPAMTCTMTDFCLPDLRGRLPVAQSTVIGSAFNQVPGTTGIGEEKHTLTTPETPSHTHTFTTAGAGAHGHSVQLGQARSYNDDNMNNVYDAGSDTSHGFFTGTTVEQKCGCGGQSSSISFDDAGGAQPNRRILFDLAQTYNGAIPVSDHTHTGTTDSTGSGTSHNVVQPSLVVAAYIIKY